MRQNINGPSKFVGASLEKIERIYLCRPNPFNFFKGCLPQISLGPFLNTSSQVLVEATLDIGAIYPNLEQKVGIGF